MLDVVCSESPPPGSRVHAEVSVRAGGSAVNACAAAVAAGASATVIGRIGADRAGDLVLAEVGDRGIAPGLARDAELPTGIAVALAGERGTAGLVAQRGANARLSPADIPEAVDADALFVSGFALFQSGSAPAARRPSSASQARGQAWTCRRRRSRPRQRQTWSRQRSART